MTAYDGPQRGCQIGKRINCVEFTRLDERSDGGPVLSPCIMTRKKCVLTIEGYGSDGPLDTVVVDLDAPVGQEELQTVPVFGNLGQGLAERGFCRDACAVMDKPVMQASDEWR